MIELKTAKYKGVEFLFEDMTTTGGNRLIKFNFPGSDKQSIERQGKVPRTFTLPAIIPHDNYFQKRDELLRVLEDGEEGVLTHPTFGDIEKVINGQYTLTEKLTELGRATILIPFEVNDSPGIPQQSGNLASQVQVESDLLNDQLETDLADGYNVTSSFVGNFNDGIDNINDVSAAFGAASETGESVIAGAANFRQAVETLASSAGNLIQAPADLAGEIAGIFEGLNNLFDAPADLFGAFSSLFPFGETDPVVNPNTAGRTERKQNRDLVRANVRTQALGFAYLSAVQITYGTTAQLDQTQNDLEAQYVIVRENPQLSNESLEQLDRLRVQAQKSLDIVRVNTSSIITIETPRKPLSVLVYEFYGDTNLFDEIANLNNIKQNAFVEGEIKVLVL